MSNKKKIIIIQPIHEAGIKLLKENSNYEYEIVEDLDNTDIKTKISKCDAISIRTANLSGELIKQLQTNQPELNITDRQVQLIKIAGLVHDIGHGCFSHFLFDKL